MELINISSQDQVFKHFFPILQSSPKVLSAHHKQ